MYRLRAFVLLAVSSVGFGFAIMWLIAWMNQLILFAMKIYKDEKANIPPQYAVVTATLFGVSFFFWRIAEFYFTQA